MVLTSRNPGQGHATVVQLLLENKADVSHSFDEAGHFGVEWNIHIWWYKYVWTFGCLLPFFPEKMAHPQKTGRQGGGQRRLTAYELAERAGHTKAVGRWITRRHGNSTSFFCCWCFGGHLWSSLIWMQEYWFPGFVWNINIRRTLLCLTLSTFMSFFVLELVCYTVTVCQIATMLMCATQWSLIVLCSGPARVILAAVPMKKFLSRSFTL